MNIDMAAMMSNCVRIMSKDRWAAALSVLLFSFTAACSASMSDKPKPEYRENPDPQQTNRLTMRIDNAPGEFKSIHGFMQFDVANRECLPPPDSNPGGHTSPVPTRSIPFELERQPDGGYTATVFTDGMIDEDYHGRGVCQWKLVNVQVQLQATGAEGETLFMADLYGDELVAGKTKALHYWKGGYPREEGFDSFPDSGKAEAEEFKPELRNELFTITLASKEMKP
jgi:hypothetical protein